MTLTPQAAIDRVRAEMGQGDTASAALWTPFPGPQTMAYESEADELFYGGAGGGGKSDLLLGLAITRHRNSIIFRREFGMLRGVDGIWERSKAIIGQAGKSNVSPVMKWDGLPGHRAIEFGAMQFEDSKNKYKGRPHDLKAFDELPDFTESQYRFVTAWLRTSTPGQRTRVVTTGNPPTTPEGDWVNAYWGAWLNPQHPNPAKPGELRWYIAIGGKDIELLGDGAAIPLYQVNGKWIAVVNGTELPYEGTPVGDAPVIRPRSRTFIPARVEDNPVYMATGYADVLDNLPEPLRSQMRFGNFQATSSDNPWQILPTAWVQAAQARWNKTPKPSGPLTALGVDPSRGGEDQFCLAARYGNYVDTIIKHEGKEAPDGSTGVMLIQQALERANGTVNTAVNVDVIGSAGSSVFDYARDANMAAVGLNGSERTDELDKSGRLRFVNKRALWHWRLREWLDPKSGQDICLPPDPRLLADLCAPRWRITPRGVQVELKADIKARIGRSPDAGESVIYSFAEESGQGAGFLAYAKQKVQEWKGDAAPPAPAPVETNPWLDALPKNYGGE